MASLGITASTFFLYMLLRPADRDIALLAVIFQIISTTGFAVAQVPYYAALLSVRDASGAPSDVWGGAMAR